MYAHTHIRKHHKFYIYLMAEEAEKRLMMIHKPSGREPSLLLDILEHGCSHYNAKHSHGERVYI